MSNPFDFNEDEESRNFEKSVIFGGASPMSSDTRDFMKKSLAAANMLMDEDEDGISSITNTKMSSVGFSRGDKQQQRPPPRYNTADLLGSDFPGTDVNRIPSNDSYLGIDDYVDRKPQVSAPEFKRISEELRKAKRTIENLKSEKWKSCPVSETVQRMVSGKEYFLEGYKALNEKQELLTKTVRTNDGNAIINVVLFLERTLKRTLFVRELRKQTSAFSHYALFLRQNQEWEELEKVYIEMCMVEDAANVRYEKACQENDVISKVHILQNWIRDFGLKQEVAHMSIYVKEEISLLEKQRQIEEEDKKRFATVNNQLSQQQQNTGATPAERPNQKPPSVLLKPLITTITYCALYHFENKTSRQHPESFKKTYQLTDKQYEWATLPPLANRHKWSDVQELLTSTNWLKRKSENSAIGYENVCVILNKAKAQAEIMNKYLSLIGNLDVRIKYASRYNAHDVVIDAIVQSRDRGQMEAYRLKVGQHSQYRQKINDLLNNTSIKWR